MKDQKEIVREQNEKIILEAAEQIFASYGFKGATTENIAKLAGLPKANLHYYYKTKAKLYCRVLEQILDDWMAAADSFNEQEVPRIALTKYVEAKMQFSRNRPYASRVWMNEVLNGAPVIGEFFETTLKSWLEERIKVINYWIKLEKIKPVDPKVFMYMIWSVTQHYADFERQLVILNDGNEYSDREFQEKTQQVTELILSSVGLNK